MQPPRAIFEWLNANYPKPRIDPEWLQGCYDWVTSEKNLDPTTDIDQIIHEIELQLLESDLRDSMLHGTGIPAQIADPDTARSTLSGPPILVQIESITEIGVSAYTLNKTREIREERLAAGAEEGQDDGEADNDVQGAGPVPNYPRAMLRLEISDGARTLRAMEYRQIPELKLGATPLGYKMLIHNVEVRRGIAFLEPKQITLKGHRVVDRDAQQDLEFAQSLRDRLRLLDPEAPQDLPAPITNGGRAPLRDISPPPAELTNNPHFDDEDQPRRRRIPNRTSSPAPIPSSSTLTSSNRKPKANTTPHSSKIPKDPINIESDDDDGDGDENAQWLSNTRDRPIKPLPARSRLSGGAADASSPGKDTGKQKQPAKPPKVVMIEDDDDDMFSDDYNSDFLAGINEAEMNAMQGEHPSSGETRISTNVSSTSAISGQHSGTVTASASAGSSHTESITIEEEEEDDKENVPMPTRHVRPRRSRSPADIIELTDSDSD